MDYLKEFKDKDIYVITHNDLDGVTSFLVAEYFLRDICNLNSIIVRDREWDEMDFKKIQSSDYVIFVDIAPDINFYNKILEYDKPKILIFDHHESSFDELGEREGYSYDLTKCGSKNFYDNLTLGKRKNRVLKRIIELANIYDMYLTEHKDWTNAKNLHNVLFGHINWYHVFSAFPPTETEKYNKFINLSLNKINKATHFFFSPFELKKISEANIKEKKQYDLSKKKMQIREDGEGNTYAYIEAKSKVSMVANRFLNELRDKIQYIVIFNNFESDSMHISLRSPKGGYDTTKLSEKWGGGGHSSASAFNFKDRNNLEQLRKGIIHLI